MELLSKKFYFYLIFLINFFFVIFFLIGFLMGLLMAGLFFLGGSGSEESSELFVGDELDDSDVLDILLVE